MIDGVAVNIEASIGIAVMAAREDSPDLLLQRADTALARARSRFTRVHVHSARCDYFDAQGLALLGQGELVDRYDRGVIEAWMPLNTTVIRVTGRRTERR